MNRQGVDPSLWGRHGWAFLDYVVAGYPEVAMESEQMALTGFLEALGTALPCEKCRVNFKRFAALKPPALYVGGKEELRTWLSSLRQSIKEGRGHKK